MEPEAPRPAATAGPSAEPADTTSGVVNRYVARIFEDAPLNPEIRRRREATIRSDVLLFIRDLRIEGAGGVRDAEIEELLHREFGDPALLREVFLRSDTRVSTFDRKTWLFLTGFSLGAIAVVFVMKAMEIQVAWHAPGLGPACSKAISTLILTLAPLTGIFGYVLHWLRSGNRYRIVPFVSLSVVAFIAAGSLRAEIEILERTPVPRSHLLVSAAIPMVDGDFRPMIRRYILDLDRTGLPRRFTRAQRVVEAHEEAPSSFVRFYWLLVICVIGGNVYAMSRMADDLALLEDLDS